MPAAKSRDAKEVPLVLRRPAARSVFFEISNPGGHGGMMSRPHQSVQPAPRPQCGRQQGPRRWPACTRVGFTENVIPQRSLASPTRGGDANLLRRERRNSHVTRDALARRQTHALSALQITDGERVIIFDFALSSHGHRQFDKRAHQLSIYFLAALRSCRPDASRNSDQSIACSRGTGRNPRRSGNSGTGSVCKFSR